MVLYLLGSKEDIIAVTADAGVLAGPPGQFRLDSVTITCLDTDIRGSSSSGRESASSSPSSED